MELQTNLTTAQKVDWVLAGLEANKSRSQLAAELGYKDYKSMDVMLRRQGYVWQDERYIPKEDKGTAITIPTKIPDRVRQILDLFSRLGNDPKKVAQSAGFSTFREMATYMDSQGWNWSSELNRYVQKDQIDAPCATTDQVVDAVEAEASTTLMASKLVTHQGITQSHLNLLNYLLENEAKLTTILNTETDSGSLPLYAVPGHLLTKSVHMSSLLDQLVRDYSKEKNVSQRNIFQVALLEFMSKYGYKEQVDRLLDRAN